ncbi:MAG: hypothetical protein N3G80_00770, partial [Candidatus Micrarchaeota archaeon]|nr:hypothetical protein [Candidatus Micrarchaeota archaeon]
HRTALKYHKTSDGSKFFLGENQMYVFLDYIFALTPTEFFCADAKGIQWGKLDTQKPLENPIIVKGEKKNVFFIRDKNLEEDIEVEIER